MYRSRGKYDRAVEHYGLALAKRAEAGDLHGRGATLNNIAAVHLTLGRHEQALDFCGQALELAEQVGDATGEAGALHNMGAIYQSWGRYDMAVTYARKALAVAQRVGDAKAEGAILGNIGAVYTSWGKYESALKHYEKALAMKRKVGDRHGEGTTLNNIGGVYHSRGLHDKAMEYCEMALAIERSIGNVKDEGTTLENLGAVNRDMGRYDKALEHYEQSLKIAEALGAPTNTVLDSIGALYLDQELTEKAEAYIVKGGFTHSLARLYLMKADYIKSRVYYLHTLEAAEENRDADLRFIGATGLGAACEAAGEWDKAAEYYRKAVDYTEEIRSGLPQSARETFFHVKIRGFYRTAPYEGLSRVLMKLNRPLEALKTSEYSKARLFAEALAKKSDVGDLKIPAEVAARDAMLEDQIAALMKRLHAAYADKDKSVVASLEPQVKDVRDKLAAHVEGLRADYPLFAATKYPQPMDLAQTALKGDEWVISYDVTDTALLTYLTHGKRLLKAMTKPTSRNTIDEAVRRFRVPMELVESGAIEEGLRAFDFEAGAHLREMLLGEVLPLLPAGASLIIVPDDCLGVIPFETLPLTDGGKVSDDDPPRSVGAVFLGDRFHISYYQSITALTLTRNFMRLKPMGSRRLVMDDPVFNLRDPRLNEVTPALKPEPADPASSGFLAVTTGLDLNFPRLEETATLGRSLENLDRAKTDRYSGMQAQKDVLFHARLQEYSTMVFATHGFFGHETPSIREPALVFTLVDQPEGKDGFLRMSEVMTLDMNAEMVALTACQTGLGRRISGEGVLGMGRAFQYAGARSVLMTLWSVAEGSSVILVDTFFTHLKKGTHKLDALRSARQSVREAGYDHPFFWSPFILVGEVE